MLFGKHAESFKDAMESSKDKIVLTSWHPAVDLYKPDKLFTQSQIFDNFKDAFEAVHNTKFKLLNDE